MGTNSEKPTIKVDDVSRILVDGAWVGSVHDRHADALRDALAAANEPVGMTVPEMIEWLDDGGELEWFEPCNGGWRPAPVWLEPAGWANQEARRPQYRRKAKAEVVPDKVPLARLISRTLIGEMEPVHGFSCDSDRAVWWSPDTAGTRDLTVDDDGLVAVKPIEAS